MIDWKIKPFNQLTPAEIYAIWQLRETVFVVEQRCIFLDADGKDVAAEHVMGYDQDTLIAYGRILYPKQQNDSIRFGRVCTHAAHRGTGLGRSLVTNILAHISAQHAHSIEIAAQVYLLRFYQSFGFKPISDAYDEDGIPHISMQLQLAKG